MDSIYFSIVSSVGLFQPDTWRFPDGPPHTSQPLVWYSMVLVFWYLFVSTGPISGWFGFLFFFFPFALIGLMLLSKLSLVLPVSCWLFQKTLASKTACSSKSFIGHRKNFCAGLVTEGRNSSVKITTLTQFLDFCAETCKSYLPVLLILV